MVLYCIIQRLARFTDNKTFGRMHFVPPERTYLKLHNRTTPTSSWCSV